MQKSVLFRGVTLFLCFCLVFPLFLVNAAAVSGDALDIMSATVLDLQDGKLNSETFQVYSQEMAESEYYLVSGSSMDEFMVAFNDVMSVKEGRDRQWLSRREIGSSGLYGLYYHRSADFEPGGSRPVAGFVGPAFDKPIVSTYSDDESSLYGAGVWVPVSRLEAGLVNIKPLSTLKQLAEAAGGYVLPYDEYWVIANSPEDQFDLVFADYSALPYVSFLNDNGWGVNQPRPDTSVLDQNGNPVEDAAPGNQTGIDVGGLTLTLPNGDINMIDNLYYDESTKTYNIDASETTYNVTENNYYTWNYSYSWTYHINYTSITYIGQTEEYDKYYEVYYELPDGRDSADLSREDLEQLNLSIDVLPYSRAVDNVSLKSLYHFDGDTRDSSYWNYRTEFDWNKGASLTYMDAGVFNGALYLDETEHDFTFTLPFFIGSDFTMQWRYYQSATPVPQNDSYLKFGDTFILRFDGASILDAYGIKICDMPVGSWNELCLTATDGMLYLYLNGVSVASWASSGYCSYFVNFHFGSEQQTFKYFDEFRYLSEDIYGAGADYTPTSVPHDTNLTLVLPDSDQIVADEWISWTPGKDTLAVIDFVNGSDSNLAGIHMFDGYRQYELPSGPDGETTSTTLKSADFSCSFEFTEQGLLVTREEGSSGVVDAGASGLCIDLSELLPAEAYSSYISYRIYLNNSASLSLSSYLYGVYDPSTSEWTFRSMHRETASNADFCPTSLMGYSSASTNLAPYYLDGDYILYPVSGSICISRIEFAYSPGGSYQCDWSKPTVHSTVSAIDSNTIHVPSLAVRTDLEVTDYQIGGARPSIPTKGLVWAMVENQRIVSIQIYNGSAWEACDGRIWTGQRWIPAGAYNVITLQDMYDIADATQDYDYIYSESGFWAWWQKSWNTFTNRLFEALGKMGGCDHAFAIEETTAATCTDPGERLFSCPLCGSEYVEQIPALGHDWIKSKETTTTYELPEGTSCPDCFGLDFSVDLDEDSAMYSCTCNDCEKVWTVQAEVTEGVLLYTCTRCDATTTDPNEDSGFFESLGSFLADGVEWVTEKLSQLIDSLSGINETLQSYLEQIKGVGGEFPAFLTAFIAVMPEDLMAVIWFSVVALVALLVWKKFFS